ncbi:MAG: hypothetical protein ABIT70_05410, partial [Sulfuriferula sp.]
VLRGRSTIIITAAASPAGGLKGCRGSNVEPHEKDAFQCLNLELTCALYLNGESLWVLVQVTVVASV